MCYITLQNNRFIKYYLSSHSHINAVRDTSAILVFVLTLLFFPLFGLSVLKILSKEKKFNTYLLIE